MMLKTYLSFLLLLACFHVSFSQMVVGQDTLVGNEWIRYDQTYYKFIVEKDGVYRITGAALVTAGVPAPTLIGSNMRIYNFGRQVPLHVSTNGPFGPADYVEFYGHLNRSELDQFLYKRPALDMLNPDYSIYTDRNAYYLAYEGTDTPLRVNNLINDINNPPLKEDYYLHRNSINYHTTVIDPYFSTSDGTITYSSFMHGEGFGKLNENSSTTQISARDRFVSGPDATLRLRFTSTNNAFHSFIVTLNDQALDTVELYNLQIHDEVYIIPLSLLADDNMLKITPEDIISRHSLVSIDLIYPHLPVLQTLPTGSIIISKAATPQYFVLSGFPDQGVQPVIYSYDGNNRMIASIDASKNLLFKWPATTADLRLEIADPIAGMQFISSLEEKTFADFSSDDTEYILITHPDLMEIGTGSDYIKYRSSVAGGAYRSKAYSILDIYDQFGYGVEKHPQSIRNFVEFSHRHWPSAKMIFIVGRAIEYHRARLPGPWEEFFFVPTFGHPGSDNLLAATVWDLVPRYPIGRLAIVSPQGIRDYLEKVKEHDASRFAGQTLEEKEWIKNVMHIGGGKDANEQNSFKSLLNSMGKLLEESDYGAKIHFFQKQSTDIIGESQSLQIEKLLNEGCGIVNYLGHSASSTFEFNIIDPSVWNNAGHYPIFSAMGCSAGQIHNTIFGLSDRYVHIPNEGTIAFISGSGSQYTGALVKWGTPWYDFIGNIGYGKTLGESVQYALQALSGLVNPDQITSPNQYRFLLEQQTFQGDPGLHVHPMPGPDYILDRNSVSFQPKVFDTKLDSFDLTFSIFNIGRNLRQNIRYKLSIQLPGGQEVELKEDTITARSFETVVTEKLALLTGGKAGVFRLLIKLDPGNLLEELPAPDAENNNNLIDNLGQLGVEFVVVDNIISAVYPQDFAIVTEIPELVVTGNNLLNSKQNIVLEIDTTALFNSPSLVSEQFINHAPTLKWKPNIHYTPDRVYYWRVSTDSISPEQGYLWSTRSFIYRPGSSKGWNQSHFYQFTTDRLDQLQADSVKFNFNFQRRVKNFRMVNRYHDVDLGLVPLFFEDGKFNAKLTSGFRTKKVHGFVVAIDSVTGNYIKNPVEGLYGSVPLTIPMEGFAYDLTTPESRQAMLNLIENVIPSGYYVFFYTYQHTGFPDYEPEEWAQDEITYGKSIFSVIEDQHPSSAIRSLADSGSKPYIILFQKDRGVIEEQIAIDADDVISISFDGGAALTEGQYVSGLIGPSQKWFSIENNIITHNDTAGATVLSAWAINKSLSDTLWISHDINQDQLDISGIDADQYPFIQLALNTSDSVTYRPAHIEYWRVLFNGYPEFIINPERGFVFIADTLLQGELMRLHTFVENVSDYAVDSVPVSLRIISSENNTIELRSTIHNLGAHATAPIDFEKSTQGLSGDHSVVLEINSGGTVNELEHGNNVVLLPMYVIGDEINPVLDVTFDGVHILDGDLVAAKPFIVISLHDENTHLKLEDTSSFEMYLQFPSDLQPRRIFFDESWVKFIKASGNGKNIASVELTPDLLEDGTYTLQVRARDASGNTSGDNDYSISFEVINEESISHLYNYPNPFSTATRFVYTLTGSGSPAYYKIQIMSIAGRIVREISHDELGPLKVGTHMTEYVWDGTDENGGRLAAGTYLYRMIVKNENMESFKRYETSRDSIFKKGWGKLVILR